MKNIIAIMLSLIFIIIPLHIVEANENSKSVSLPSHMEVDTFVVDENNNQIYMAVTSGAQSKVIKKGDKYVREHPLKENMILIMDSKTLETKSKMLIGDRNISITDMVMKDGKLYVATTQEIFKYDPEINKTEKLVSDPAEGIYLQQIEVTEEHIYFTDYQSWSDLNPVPRVYDYNIKSESVSPIKGYSHMRPSIAVHPNKPILYIGDSSFLDSKRDYTLYALNTETNQTLKQKFPADSQSRSAEIFVHDKYVYYGLYKVKANDIKSIVSSVNDQTLKYGFIDIHAGKLLSLHSIYDSDSEKPKVQLRQSIPNLYLYRIDENHNIFQVIREVEPKKIILKREPLTNYVSIDDKYVGQPSANFKDVHRFHAEIDFLYNEEIINGFTLTKFGPYEPIKRVDAIRMIMRDLNVDIKNIKDPGFSDMSVTSPGYKQVAKAHELGIIDGKTSKKFDPSGHLTRAEMAKILVSSYDDLRLGNVDYFLDITKEYWAAPYINSLFANNITEGYPDQTYRPTKKITRQEFAAFMARHLNDEFIQ
ncbi:S-layer homology domain-containing protein [Pontibacillus marinus]|uniref:S-layer homology domain-containing protein n=1 Tax=Pontibacillus marinus TaxID=273164 RepID=UPI0018CD181F|nr:S-layer homology domain-containing protein [Pontibacillus marinus]